MPDDADPAISRLTSWCNVLMAAQQGAKEAARERLNALRPWLPRAPTQTSPLSPQFTMDIFNIINKNKNNTLDVNLLYTAAGQETAASDMRQFQFGARLSF